MVVETIALQALLFMVDAPLGRGFQEGKACRVGHSSPSPLDLVQRARLWNNRIRRYIRLRRLVGLKDGDASNSWQKTNLQFFYQSKNAEASILNLPEMGLRPLREV